MFPKEGKNTVPKFSNVSCSQCGEDLGPGDEGVSRCNDHDFILRGGRNDEALRISVSGETAFLSLPLGEITADTSDLINLRNWLERKLGCLYDQSAPTDPPLADGERG